MCSTDGEPRPRDVRLGLTDGSATELVAGELTEGMEVIVGTAAAGRSASK
jgi:HlyD family secretion protein